MDTVEIAASSSDPQRSYNTVNSDVVVINSTARNVAFNAKFKACVLVRPPGLAKSAWEPYVFARKTVD